MGWGGLLAPGGAGTADDLALGVDVDPRARGVDRPGLAGDGADLLVPSFHDHGDLAVREHVMEHVEDRQRIRHRLGRQPGHA